MPVMPRVFWRSPPVLELEASSSTSLLEESLTRESIRHDMGLPAMPAASAQAAQIASADAGGESRGVSVFEVTD